MIITNESGQFRERMRLLERKLGALKEGEVSCESITMAQCHALVEIGRAGSISLNRLADLLLLENSTMSKTVNNLVISDLVKREIDPQDRRYITISLTESGRILFENIEGRMGFYYKVVLEKIPEDKRGQLLESLDLLLEALDKSNSKEVNGCGN